MPFTIGATITATRYRHPCQEHDHGLLCGLDSVPVGGARTDAQVHRALGLCSAMEGGAELPCSY